MRIIFKLIVASSIYALFFLLHIELLLNVYRISRITRLELSTINIGIFIFSCIIFIFSVPLFYFLNGQYLKMGKINYIGSFLWFPFSMLFLFVFRILFPMDNQGDHPAPIIGLIILVELIFYQVYLLMIIKISNSNSSQLF